MNTRLKILAKTALYYAPAPLSNMLHKRIEQRRLEEGLARMRRCKVSKAEVSAALDTVDFDHDIMLHTSTMNIGKIEGGVKWITDEILSRIDLTRHTLVVSALPYFGSFADWLETENVFNPATAPIAVGAINERISRMPEALRSAHPTHSVVAIGKDAHYYVDNHLDDPTPFGPGSPYRRLLEREAHVLLFGATLNNITFIHAVEDALGEAYPIKNVYARKKYNVAITDADGKVVRQVEVPVHDRHTSIRRDSAFFLPDGLEHGYIKATKLGEGMVCDIDARALADRYVEMLQHGHSIYGRVKPMRAEAIKW